MNPDTLQAGIVGVAKLVHDPTFFFPVAFAVAVLMMSGGRRRRW